MFRAVVASVLFVVVLAQFQAEPPLPSGLPITNKTITVSGISSGGAMAIQLHVAYSSLIKGVGAIAAPPYYCAQGGLTGAMMCMFSPLIVNLEALVAKAKSYESSGLIDPLSGLKDGKAYIFSGTKDTVVAPGTVQKSILFYERFTDKSNIKTVMNIPAQHSWITDNQRDSSCGYLGNPYINNCQLDASGEILKLTLFDVQKIDPKPRIAAKKENLFRFDQSRYGSTATGLYSWGNIYIPTACQVKRGANTTECFLHFSFHGCEQNFDYIGERFSFGSGLNEWAEANNIVVVYPQATKISLLDNPKACWDWWGYANDADYANKNGVQMKAVRQMIATLTNEK